MLLPSALSCDAQSQTAFAKTSSTARSTFLAPPRAAAYCQSPAASSPNIFAACSALQSLLASTLPLSSTTAVRPSTSNSALDSPISFTTAPSSKLFYSTSSKVQKQKKKYPSQGPKSSGIKSQYTPPPAPSRKRRRDDDHTIPDNTITQFEDKENDANNAAAAAAPATPKRKRRCLPHPRTPCSRGHGRARDDLLFPRLEYTHGNHHHHHHHHLQEPQTPFQLQPQTTFISPSHPAPMLDVSSSSSLFHHHHYLPQNLDLQHQQQSHQAKEETEEQEQEQTPDDARLMNLILTKLQLRHRHQSNGHPCAAGSASSIEERFRLLVGDDDGDGAGGLGVRPFRRGEGVLRRGSVKGVEF